MNALAATGAFTAAAVTVLAPWQPVPVNTGAFTARTVTLKPTLPPVPVNTVAMTAPPATRTTVFSIAGESGVGAFTAPIARPAPVISRAVPPNTAGFTGAAVSAATVGALGKGLNPPNSAAVFTSLTPTVTGGAAPVPAPEKPAAFTDPAAAGVRAYLPTLFPGVLIDTGTFQRQREGGGYGGVPPGPEQKIS